MDEEARAKQAELKARAELDLIKEKHDNDGVSYIS